MNLTKAYQWNAMFEHCHHGYRKVFLNMNLYCFASKHHNEIHYNELSRYKIIYKLKLKFKFTQNMILEWFAFRPRYHSYQSRLYSY